MNALLVSLALCLSQSQQEPPKPPAKQNSDAQSELGALDYGVSPSKVLSKMFERYKEAQTISGSSEWRQEARGVSIGVRTRFQLQRPSRLYIEQVSNTYGAGKWLVTSDGQYFSYQGPKIMNGQAQRFRETVIVNKNVLTVGDILHASRKGLGDPHNPFVELSCFFRTGIIVLKNSWYTVEAGRIVELNGQKARIIKGAFQPEPQLAPTGTYAIYVNDKYELLKYETRETLGIPTGKGNTTEQIEVLTSWQGTTELDGKIDPTLFKVVE